MPIIIGIFGFICLLGLGWAIQGNSFFMYKFFAPKYEQVRRETFEQSKAYRQGMVQELQQMQLDYIHANAEQKEALAAVIIQRTADLDPEAMSPALRLFVEQVRRDRGM